MNPVPEHPGVDTPYGLRGPYWSCDGDSRGHGIHTGADFAAPAGARVVAARPGRLEHVSFGSAFGSHQVAVVTEHGRDFYAHLRWRKAEGPVEAGEKIGEVGDEGNATGPHLHFERHTTESGGWSCGIVTDPQPSIDWEDDMNEQDWDRLRKIVKDEVEKGWDRKMKVTQPSGDEQEKAREQVLRETYQTVKREG